MMSKLGSLTDRFGEVSALLSDAEVMSNREKFTALSKEFAEIEPVVMCYQEVTGLNNDLDDSKVLLEDDDAEIRQLAEMDIQESKEKLSELTQKLQTLLLPRDPNDHSNVFLEIRAGTGGDEAALFSGSLFRMYNKFAENQGWRVEILNERPGEHGGYKEIISRIEGRDVYSQLKFESGAHRVQRVPETESQGRIHTSACTVAVLPELAEIDSVEIRKEDLRVDTFRSSGAGGQHVNTTDSAVRITHVPTGIVVTQQDERSQHKNKAKAMQVLRARLYEAERERTQSEQAGARKAMVGSGDRSERIRTYNFPQGRVTDHRIGFTIYRLAEVLRGDLQPVVDALAADERARLLAEGDV